MALPGTIDVNEVYTTVLAILNKEQRGYLTPYEFNKLATQVQLEVFEKYFEDLNQQLRSSQNSSEYADRVKTIEEKIDSFRVTRPITVAAEATAPTFAVADMSSLADPGIPHRFGELEFHEQGLAGVNLPVVVEKVTKSELLTARRSRLTTPTSKFPMCFIEGTKIFILPKIISRAATTSVGAITYSLDYVQKPTNVVWDFTLGTLGQYIFNPTTTAGSLSTDFTISSLDESEVILKILAYAGVVIRDSEITQIASQGAAQIDNQQQQ